MFIVEFKHKNTDIIVLVERLYPDPLQPTERVVLSGCQGLRVHNQFVDHHSIPTKDLTTWSEVAKDQPVAPSAEDD